VPELLTSRLVLRPWRDDDLAPFAALNADAEVMRHFPSVLTRAESDALAGRLRGGLDERGWGLHAVEVRASREFIGFIGLSPVPDEVAAAAGVGGVEVGWRLARLAWGHGYATEGAREAMRFAFDDLALPELVSFTAVTNRRSRAVMERLGMRQRVEFEHPRLPAGHVLRPHVLYAKRRDDT